MFCENYENLTRALTRRGFTVHYAKDAAQAKSVGLALIGNGSVGFGGSVTLGELKLYDTLKAQGNEVYSHTYAPPEEKDAVRLKASRAQWFVASTNAITADGRLVNIDGTGNRVASMIIGPENVLLFIGKNKYAPTVEAGIERTKRVTCPQNAQRLHLDTLPCGRTGKCADCSSPQRMCNVTTIMEGKPRLIKSFHLILIDEEIGW